METEIKVVKALIKGNVRGKEMTIREIAGKIGADYKITHIAVQRLIKRNILNTKTIGKSTLCSLNNSYYGIEIYKAEDERRNELLRNKDINQLLKEIISKIGTSLFIFIVFGSYAKGSQTKNSDIDLIFILRDKKLEDKINSMLSLIPLKTHALVFSEEEFIRMLNSRSSNVAKEALDNYIILYGIESFYKLKNL